MDFYSRYELKMQDIYLNVVLGLLEIPQPPRTWSSTGFVVQFAIMFYKNSKTTNRKPLRAQHLLENICLQVKFTFIPFSRSLLKSLRQIVTDIFSY